MLLLRPETPNFPEWTTGTAQTPPKAPSMHSDYKFIGLETRTYFLLLTLITLDDLGRSHL